MPHWYEDLCLSPQNLCKARYGSRHLRMWWDGRWRRESPEAVGQSSIYGGYQQRPCLKQGDPHPRLPYGSTHVPWYIPIYSHTCIYTNHTFALPSYTHTHEVCGVCDRSLRPPMAQDSPREVLGPQISQSAGDTDPAGCRWTDGTAAFLSPLRDYNEHTCSLAARDDTAVFHPVSN